MQYWIDYLVSNAAACEDFIKWSKEAESNLSKAIATAVREDKMEDARSIAHEATVYGTLRKRIQAELRERQSQAQYDQQFEGRL